MAKSNIIAGVETYITAEEARELTYSPIVTICALVRESAKNHCNFVKYMYPLKKEDIETLQSLGYTVIEKKEIVPYLQSIDGRPCYDYCYTIQW